MKAKLLSTLLFIFLLSSCKREGTTITILEPCLSLNKTHLNLNEKVVIKSCSEANGASVRVSGINGTAYSRSFVFESKRDSAIVGFPDTGRFEIKLRATNFNVGDYSEWARDTIVVNP